MAEGLGNRLRNFKYWPTRPFSNAHWALLVGLLGLWEFAILGQPCKEGPRYFEVCLATSTVCIAFWVADLREGVLVRWGRIPRVLTLVLYDLCAFFLVLVLVALPLAVVVPAYQCYTPRVKVSELVLSGSSFRQTITERAEKQQSLKDSGRGLTVNPGGRVSGGYVSPDGIIVITSDDPFAIVVLRPSMENASVKWSCAGFPLKWMPQSCRQLPQF
jgi:type IV pilus assembly protein PilA